MKPKFTEADLDYVHDQCTKVIAAHKNSPIRSVMIDSWNERLKLLLGDQKYSWAEQIAARKTLEELLKDRDVEIADLKAKLTYADSAYNDFAERKDTEIARLRKAIQFVFDRDRSRGYPTGSEYVTLLDVLRAALKGK